MLDSVERRDRREAFDALGRRFDVELEVVVCGQIAQASIASVGDDGLEAWQALAVELLLEKLSSDLHIVRLRRIHSDGQGQPENLDQDAPLGPDRPTASTAGVVECRPGSTASHCLPVNHHHRRVARAVLAQPDVVGKPGHRQRPDAVIAPASPLLPDRRPGRVCGRQIAPLETGASDEQHRIYHLAPRVCRRPSLSALRVKERLDQAPLGVLKLDHGGHAGQSEPAP